MFASNMPWDLCHISFFSSFFLRRHKKQDPSRGAYRETKSYQRLEGKKEMGSGKRPVSPHLQPEPRLKCSSQHRRPMTHIEADKAPARVSEPSAGERERKKMCKKEKRKNKRTCNDQRPKKESVRADFDLVTVAADKSLRNTPAGCTSRPPVSNAAPPSSTKKNTQTFCMQVNGRHVIPTKINRPHRPINPS